MKKWQKGPPLFSAGELPDCPTVISTARLDSRVAALCPLLCHPPGTCHAHARQPCSHVLAAPLRRCRGHLARCALAEGEPDGRPPARVGIDAKSRTARPGPGAGDAKPACNRRPAHGDNGVGVVVPTDQ